VLARAGQVLGTPVQADEVSAFSAEVCAQQPWTSKSDATLYFHDGPDVARTSALITCRAGSVNVRLSRPRPVLMQGFRKTETPRKWSRI
jgi:hypothetical protein